MLFRCISWVEFPTIEKEDESIVNHLTIDMGNASLQLSYAQAEELCNTLKKYLDRPLHKGDA